MQTRGHLARFSRAVAALCVGALAASLVIASTPQPADADSYPGLADIAAAKAAVADAKAGVGELDAAIVQLETARAAAENQALLAAEAYVDAKDASDSAARQSADAERRAADADAELEAARQDLGAVAVDAYRTGGTITSLEAIVGANGFDDVIARSEANDKAASHVEAIVQKVKAAQIVADTMSDFAKDAAAEAAAAADEAAKALAAAQDAQRVAEQAVADAEATREAAVERLASLQKTTVALERERQAGLARERADRDRAAYEKAVRDAEAKAAAQAAAQPVANGGTGGTTTPPPSSGGSGGGATTPPPATGGGGGVATGTPKSGADAAAVAVAHALTLVGSPYQLGGDGPGYDCSGLVEAAWRAAGFTVSGSSKSQYKSVPLVPMSELRPGDLVFYGAGRNADLINHVALYIGNGQVVEATVPGSVAKVRAFPASYRLNDIMPMAGRP